MERLDSSLNVCVFFGGEDDVPKPFPPGVAARDDGSVVVAARGGKKAEICLVVDKNVKHKTSILLDNMMVLILLLLLCTRDCCVLLRVIGTVVLALTSKGSPSEGENRPAFQLAALQVDRLLSANTSSELLTGSKRQDVASEPSRNATMMPPSCHSFH